MRDTIDELVASVLHIPEGTGLVVGVLQGGRSSVYGYGLVDETQKPGGETVYEIGSISKIFTTAALATMLNDGILELDTPVCALVPALRNLPAEITLLSLATHTSGLPKMPSDVLTKMMRNRKNPYVDYSAQDMLRYLSRCRPERLLRRMGKIEYSNLGIGLLGFILAQKMGVPFEQVIVNSICEPLRMHDTRIRLSSDMKTRLAPPRLANGKAASNWDMPAFEGAGGIRSTANDMIKLLQASVGPTDLPLPKALQTCHDIRETNFVSPSPLQIMISRYTGSEHYTTRYRQAVGLGGSWEDWAQMAA